MNLSVPSDPDIWAKLERSIASRPKAPESIASAAVAASQPKARRIPSFRILDLVGILVWSYFFTKIFIFDADRAIATSIGPWAVEALDYRVVFYLLIVAAGAWYWRKTWWRFLYVALFPFVVLFWKIPYFLYRRRSWALFLAGAQTMASVSSHLRYRLVAGSLSIIAAIFVLFVDFAPLVGLSTIFLIGLLALTFVRYVSRIFKTPSFTQIQSNWIRRVMAADALRTTYLLGDEYKRPEIERFDDTQAQHVAMKMSTGIVVNKVLYFWAYQLDRYRRSYSPALLFAALSFASLFLATVLTLGLVNYGLNQVAPQEYSISADAPFVSFLVYGLTSLSGSPGGGITAIGQIAQWIQLLSGLVGVGFLLAVVVNVVLVVRRERDDQATSALVSEIKRRAREQERVFHEEYAVCVDEAKRRLEAIGAGFAALVTYVTRNIPEEFLAPDEDSAADRSGARTRRSRK